MPLILDGTLGISGVDGTAGTPAAQGTDSNTGVFYATDIVGISTGGTERMRIDSSGNVGIGTSSTSSFRLSVVGAASSSSTIRVEGGDGANTNAVLDLTGRGSGAQYNNAEIRSVGQNALGGTLSFYVDDTSGLIQERMRIDSSGNLLVGTTTTTKNLRLGQKIAATSIGATFGGINMTSYPGAAASEAPILDFQKSRGSTNESMTVVASGDQLGAIVFRGADGTNFVDSAVISAQVDGTPGSNDMPGRLVFSTTADGASSATERMRIDSSGNVGIGTSSPTTVSGFRVLDVAGSTNGGYIQTTNGTIRNSLYQSGGLGFVGTQTNHDLGFVTNGSERMRITSGGDLLVGTTAALSAAANRGNITINGSSSAILSLGTGGTLKGYLFHAGTDMVLQNSANGYVAFSTNATERARITSGGDVLVAKTAADAATLGVELRANGRIFSTLAASTSANDTLDVYSTGAGAYRFYVQMDGKVNATNTTIAAISDQRLKENIQDIDVGLDALMALKPRKFDWKAGKGKNIKGDRGWIAQEFEQVFPEMIGTWKDPAPEGEEPYKSVAADLIPVLVKAIQELNSKVEAQAAEIALLKYK